MMWKLLWDDKEMRVRYCVPRPSCSAKKSDEANTEDSFIDFLSNLFLVLQFCYSREAIRRCKVCPVEF
jgi:hypothetical protein